MIALALAMLAASPANVGVAEREWHLSSYMPSVRRGSVAFNVHNFGEDAHDFQVRGPKGFRSRSTGAVDPGDTTVLTVRLRRPGSYRLLCTLPGHAKLGMRATIRVR